jgi:hypothetical protein
VNTTVHWSAFEFSATDRLLFKAIVETAQQIYETLGAELVLTTFTYQIGGFASDEAGTVRMGKGKKTKAFAGNLRYANVLNQSLHLKR